MPSLLALVLVPALAAPRLSPAPPMRLAGLDRLYFTQVGTAERLDAPPPVAPLLPRQRAGPLAHPPSDRSALEEISVTEFALPLPAWPRSLVLRQVLDPRHPRIQELWFALYDGGRRSDVWHFQALPSLTDNKLLPNYSIAGVEAGPDGAVIVRLQGSMFRPQGAWWASGKVVTLTSAGGALTFRHLRQAYGFIHDYDRGDPQSPPGLGASVEREAGGRFERRDVYPVTAEALKACGVESEDEVGGPWDEMVRIAQCLTSVPGAKTTSRALDEPSFGERGYKAPE